ncbi:MAG: Fpg/Nei family DNA glycosylase [Methanobacterium sp.]|nr:Fpg/Nei family DNA glycosylase [Methanobacterium sp.]
MPELPSVEIFKEYFDETSLQQPITDVSVISPEILMETTTTEMKESLEGHKFTESIRYGKYLFGKLDNDLFLIMHFGMTGYLHYYTKNSSKYPRLLLKFSGGNFLAFDDARKFGKLGLTQDPDEFIEKRRLGPDALEVNFEDFQEIFRDRKGMIKPLLLNQNILAGIGNLYADEMLYQSRIHPLTHADQLDDPEWEHLFKNMKKVLHKAIEHQDKIKSLPASYLLPHRYKGGKCPEGGELEIIKVGGRTTFVCSKRQKMKDD